MSASAYTHRRQVQARARVVKVEYKGGKAINYNPIYSSIACNPDFSVIEYNPIPLYCNKIIDTTSCNPYIPPTYSGVLDGEYSTPNEDTILDGGFSYETSYPVFIDAGNS